MRILYVVHQFLPPRHVAGTEIYTMRLARAIQARGHEAILFFTESHADREQYGLSRGDFEGLPFLEAVHNYRYPTFRHTWLDERMEAIFEEVLGLVRPDLVHFQHLHLHSLGYIDIAHARRLPMVYTLHEYLLMCPRGGQLLRPGLVPCPGPEETECARCADASEEEIRERRRGIRERLERVDLFLSPSAFLRDRFIAEGLISPERILHSDNGFFTEPFAGLERVPSPRLRVGYVGTLADYKGVHLLVDAARVLQRPDVAFRIHGDPEIFPDYSQRLLAMDRPANLTFEGPFRNDEAAGVLAGLDVLVVPSLWFENSPLTIHEAYLAGMPVVAAGHGGMAELVAEGVSGLHFPPGDARGLAAALRRLLEEPGLLERLRRGIPPVKEIARDAADMEERYRRLLARPGQ
ncbi:MAG: glycosyltransferase family 4 protein [Planctomycetes bacterium]|nr:glycosyltransferase family 4 protein [Planctomycetota bacterium]